MIIFLTGILTGVAGMLWFYFRARREAEHLEEGRLAALQEKQTVVDFMHHMAEALADTPSREELLQRIVHAAILCTDALSACIFEQVDEKQMRGAAVEGLFPPHRPLPELAKGKLTTRAKFIEQVLKSEMFPVGEGVVGRVAASRQGELIAHAATDRDIVRHADSALEVRSVIAVPLLFRDRFFGVLAVTNPADGLPFTPTDFTLVQSIAEQAALALHNAAFLHLQIERKQLDLDLSLASGIQQMLLPQRAPRVDGLDIDARYTPAQQVGGDLYDLIPLGGRRLGVAVADVSGKGIPASLLMAICRTNLRQIAPRHESPARVLTELNRVMETEMGNGFYITMLYAVLDGATGRVVFARAGHELPLVVRQDAASGVRLTEFPASEGMPLGLVPDDIFAAAIEEREVTLGAGDVIVFYTDGITEAPNPEEKEFSGARLADTVRTLQVRASRDLNDGVLETVRRFAGGAPQRDDLTLVTVKRA